MSRPSLRLGFSRLAPCSAVHDNGPFIAALALSFALLMAGIGVTVDDSTASNTRISLNAIADAAVLAAVSTPHLAATTNTGEREERLQEMMRQDFEAQIDSRPVLKETLRTASFSLDIMGDTVTATTCYRADHPTVFSRFLGQQPIIIVNCASATSAPKPVDETSMPPLDAAGSPGNGETMQELAALAATPGEFDFVMDRMVRGIVGQRQVRLSR